MTSVPAGIAAKAALTRQDVVLSVIKQNSQQDQLLVKLLDEAANSAPVNQTRGSNVNIQV